MFLLIETNGLKLFQIRVYELRQRRKKSQGEPEEAGSERRKATGERRQEKGERRIGYGLLIQ